MNANKSNTILVVDDTPLNVKLMLDHLTMHGFKVLVAQDGISALEQARIAKPDLILLDIMMPGTDGFETCEKLKWDTKTRNIPVIFLTAISESINKVRGFEAGAVDYITKPFNFEEMLARVNTQITLNQLQKSLKEKNEHLNSEISERKQLEKSLKHRVGIEEIIAEISASFIDISPDKLDEKINYALEKIGKFNQVNQCYVFLFSDDKTKMSNTHEWCAPGTKPSISELQNLPIDLFPWFGSKIEKSGVVHVPSVSKLSSKSKELKRILKAHKIKCVLDVPFFYKNQPLGFLGFDSCGKKEWSDEDIRMLKLVGETFANAIQHARAEQELKFTQAKLAQSEKMGALGKLVAGVAHEINTPIGAISSMNNTLELAIKKLKSSIEPQMLNGEYQNVLNTFKVLDSAIEVFASASERVSSIVRSLRGFARLDEAQLKKVDIHEGIEQTLKLIDLKIKNRIKIIREYSKLPFILCYPGSLNQVFLNVLLNACDAIPEKGEIRIKTHIADKRVYIKIQDNGIGIPKENFSRIFDPGFTTKGVSVGTGLGLSLCYQIMQEHRGEIRVESELGAGTTFTIKLPVDLDKKIAA